MNPKGARSIVVSFIALSLISVSSAWSGVDKASGPSAYDKFRERLSKYDVLIYRGLLTPESFAELESRADLMIPLDASLNLLNQVKTGSIEWSGYDGSAGILFGCHLGASVGRVCNCFSDRRVFSLRAGIGFGVGAVVGNSTETTDNNRGVMSLNLEPGLGTWTHEAFLASGKLSSHNSSHHDPDAKQGDARGIGFYYSNLESSLDIPMSDAKYDSAEARRLRLANTQRVRLLNFLRELKLEEFDSLFPKFKKNIEMLEQFAEIQPNLDGLKLTQQTREEFLSKLFQLE